MAKKKKATKKKATKKTTKKAAAKRSGEMLLVGSKVKDALRTSGLNVSGDALEGLNDVVHWYISQAVSRTEANGRKTVRKHDFMS